MKISIIGCGWLGLPFGEYLVKKGLPFRESYKIVGQLVAYAIAEHKSLNDLKLEEYYKFSKLFDDGVYQAIDLKYCVEKRTSEGAPSKQSVEKQIIKIQNKLKTLCD